MAAEVGSEQTFSLAQDFITYHHNHLHDETVEHYMVVWAWLAQSKEFRFLMDVVNPQISQLLDDNTSHNTGNGSSSQFTMQTVNNGLDLDDDISVFLFNDNNPDEDNAFESEREI